MLSSDDWEDDDSEDFAEKVTENKITSAQTLKPIKDLD